MTNFIESHNPLIDPHIQIMDENGVINEKLRPKEMTDEVILKLYEKILFCRMVNDRALKMQRSGRMGTFTTVEGQEALQIGSEYALEKTDWLVPAFRELPAMWAHGVPMEQIFYYWMGNEIGSYFPEGVKVLPISIPVGSQMLHAVGLSWAAKMRGEKTVAVTYFGDGGSSEGDFHEAMNFAGVFKTPTILICQNNQYAISVPRTIQTASRTIAQKAIAYGFPGLFVDGNDLLAMYAATKEAVDRARKGEGPTLIEAYTYRFGDHTTADDSTKYRAKEEVEKWRPKDPMRRLQLYLAKQNLWSEAIDQQLRDKLLPEVDLITQKCQTMPVQTVDEIFDYTYATLTPHLVEQKAYLKEIQSKKNP